MPTSRPNILWYCTDQQRFDTIGALGNPYVQTPVIDGLVREGVAFTHAYCQSPICTPSRASFLTGMYPARVHCTRNGNASFPDWPPVITKLIAESGYECGLIGKFHLQSAGRRTEPRIDDGYSYWRFSHAPRDDWDDGHHYAEWVRAAGGNLNALRESDDRVPTELHQTTWASECAIEFIRQPRERPWLLSVNVYDPHPPFIPPRAYLERFDPAAMPGPYFRESDLAQQEKLAGVDFQGTPARPDELGGEFVDGKTIQAKYYAMIALIDDQFARLLDVLEQTGQRDNTVIIFTSDHGEALGDHGLVQKGCRFYEGLVRVPLIFAWPGQIEQDVQSPALVELLDKSATIMELAGLPLPDYFQGKSLLPILRGKASPDHHRDFVRSEYFDALAPEFVGQASSLPRQIANLPHSPHGVFPGGGTFATMYRDRRYKLSIYHGHGLGELYDLDNDPWEFENLWDSPEHQELRHRLTHASFDATMLLTVDVGSERIAPM